jgi:plastocyanin
MTPRMTVAIGSLLLAATTLVGCGASSNNGSAYSSPTSPTATTDSTPTAPSTTPASPGPTTSTSPDPAPNGVPAVADVVITINGMDADEPFSPRSATLKVGQTVAWVNADSVPHTATSNSDAFNTGILAPGATSAPMTMGRPGAFAYHCEIHPSMTGTLVVVAPVL